MQKILFPLYMKEDEEDFLFYRDAFVKEGFRFAQARDEGLLLRADAMLVSGNEGIREDPVSAELLNTALSRNIPIILVHRDRMPSLAEQEGVIGADTISFDALKILIAEKQSDIYRPHEEEGKGSRFFTVLCIVFTVLLAAVLIWKAASLADFGGSGGENPADPGEQAKQAVVRVYSVSSMNEDAWRGCGFVISEDGYIVTNAHVVDHAAVSYFVTYRENRYEAEVIQIADHEDIALIHINTPTRYKLKIAEKAAEKDDPLYAAGYPGNQKFTVLEGTAYGGLITFQEGVSYAPVRMALKPGISGSPVLNESGQVAGIASAVSANDENLSYMVSCETLRDFLKDNLFVSD